MTEYRWLCQPVQPSVPTAPPTPAHPSYIIDSALPPVSGDEFAMLQAEATDLRRELAAAQALCDAYADDYRRAISQRETLDRQLLRERVALKYTESVIECQRALEADLRRQLATCQEVRLAELALGTQSDALLERAIAEAADLRRQLAEEKAQREQAQDSAAVAWAKAAASPALIEEYAQACHYAGSSGLAIVDWSQWLSRRATRR